MVVQKCISSILLFILIITIVRSNPNNAINKQQQQQVGEAFKLAGNAINPLLERYETLGVFDHVKHHHSENSKNKGKPLVDKKQVDKEVDKNVLNKLVQGDDEHFSERFMNLFKPTFVMPEAYSSSSRHHGNSEMEANKVAMSMFAPAPPPPGGINGKPPPPPACLPPGEPRRIWARDTVLTTVDAKHRKTPTMACAYECALRCAPCKAEDEKANEKYAKRANIIRGVVSEAALIEEQFINEHGKHDMVKCEMDCMPGCLKNPPLVSIENKTKLSSFLELSSRINAPKLTPEQTLLMRQKLAAKFSSGVSTQLRGNNNNNNNIKKSSNNGIVKPQYADQRGINDGMHRYQGVGATIEHAVQAGQQGMQGQRAAAGASVHGKVGAGGPWWLNPPPWWLPPPPEWGSPPPSVYSPFYSPYSIQQSGGMSAGQNSAPAYSPTPLPYFFLQMEKPVVEKYNRFQ